MMTMRRIGTLSAACVAFVFVLGCGTTQRDVKVIDQPGEAVLPHAYSSKGGTTATAPPPIVGSEGIGYVATGKSFAGSTAARPTTSSKLKAAPAPKPEKVAAKPAPAAKPTEAKPAEVKPKEAAPAKEMAMAKPSGAPKGVVRQVNNEFKFIVIEFDTEKPLAVGTPLQVWRGNKLVAKAKLDEPVAHWPLGVAAIVEGNPEKEDSVTY